jgi:hygromycin-B 7''-O-kinase
MNPETAQAIVEEFRPDFAVAGVVSRTGGEVSQVYEIRGASSAPPLILKVYAPQWRPKLVKEVFVYRLLARHGVRHIPRVLHAAPFGIPALPRAYAVMTCLAGQPLADVEDGLTDADRTRVYRQMGRLLAAVHRIGQDHWGYLTTRVVDVRTSNTAYMTDQFARRLSRFGDLGGDPRLARAIGRHVIAHADLFAACSAPVLCHNDYHGGNVLVSQVDTHPTVSGFVDVEGAVAADPLLDLARTDYYALAGDAAKWAAFISGYGPLPADWTERLAIYRLHHALELWNWSAAIGKPDDQARARADLDNALR